jgi:O-Antigen ligase
VSGTRPEGGNLTFLVPTGETPVADSVGTRSERFDAVTLLTVYLALLYFIPSTLVLGPLGGAGTPAIVSSLCILLWYIASWITGRVTPSGGGRPVRLGMLAFSITVLLSFVAAMTREITELEVLGADRQLIILVSWVGLVVVMSQSITSYDRLEVLLRRAVLGAAVVAAIGIFQYYTGVDITKFIQIPGLVPRVDITTLLSRNGLNRPSSTATQPIEFGVVMAMILPFALQRAFNPASTGKGRGKFRRWIPVALIAYAIPVSLSRSGIVGALVALAFLFPTWNRQRQLGALAVGCVGAVGLKGAAPGLLRTFVTYFGGLLGNSNSYIGVQSRTADYSYVFHYVSQRPLFGMGFGTFVPEIYIFTDNTYLNALAELGFVGIVVLLFMYLTGIYSAAAGRRRTHDKRRRETGQALVASMAVGIAVSATFDSLKFPMFTGVFFLIMGACGAYLGIMTAESSHTDQVEAPISARGSMSV